MSTLQYVDGGAEGISPPQTAPGPVTENGSLEIEVPRGGRVRLTLSEVKGLAGVGAHLSPDPEAAGEDGPAPELFLCAGTLAEPADELVLHVASRFDPTTGSRHRYRVDFGPRRGLVSVRIDVGPRNVRVSWKRRSENPAGKRARFTLRTVLPVGGATGFLRGSTDRLYLRRDGLLDGRSDRHGAGYGSLQTTTEIWADTTGGGEGGEATYNGGGGNSGAGGDP